MEHTHTTHSCASRKGQTQDSDNTSTPLPKHTPPDSLSERIVQNWFSGIPSPELTRLADAAPDLLEALKLAFNFVPDLENISLIRNAIAKAEGK